ncbi:phage holin, LLH family, partial [Clostridium tyrobutyricum]
ATLVDWIEQKAVAGVKAAEQLAHTGSLQTNEEKFKSAQETVYAALKEINVTPTDNQKKLIDDFIQEAVNDLGHAPVSE